MLSNVNEELGVGYLTDGLEVCILSSAALQLTAASCSVTPTNCIKYSLTYLN